MQINGSFPLQFLNNPPPGRSDGAGQISQVPNNTVKSGALNPATAINPADQTRNHGNVQPAGTQTGQSANKPGTPRSLNIFA